eukprot:358519_1
MKQVVTNKRMTKSLDSKGKFRMQVRGTIYFIKSGWCLIMHIVSLLVFTLNGKWFMDHFIYLEQDTVGFSPYQHISVSILIFYPWEVAANRYGKTEWSTIAHHFVASLAALAILLGRFIRLEWELVYGHGSFYFKEQDTVGFSPYQHISVPILIFYPMDCAYAMTSKWGWIIGNVVEALSLLICVHYV